MNKETKELLVRVARIVATEVCKAVLNELEKPRETVSVFVPEKPLTVKEVN